MMLSSYRVLDLADEKGFICGKVLAELGADVIKIEKPGGDPSRKIGPFWHDDQQPEKSLYWLAGNLGKRGITLDITCAEGQDIFKQLVRTADIIIETFPPGTLASIGLDYQHCAGLKTGIIMTSITPYGQEGPYRDFKTYDIQAQAMGGTVYVCGYPDKAPLSWGGQQAFYQAGLQGATGTMIALWHREMTGEGQHVDVSVREAMIVLTTTEAPVASWIESKTIKKRLGSRQEDLSGGVLRWFYTCRDGYVIWRLTVGVLGHMTNSFITWMAEEGMAETLQEEVPDWTEIGLNSIHQAQISHWEEIFARFFLTKTKQELLEGALRYNIILYPVSNMADVAANEQLMSRGYWVELTHPEVGETIRYPGVSFKTSESPADISRSAPLIGMHNKEIYLEEMGFSEAQLEALMRHHVI